jgi:hypothetical protein
MAYRLITCPETAHLEMIHDDPHPLGILILACTRFRPSCAITCPRTCATRMDRRAQLDNDPTLDDDGDDALTGVDLAFQLDRVREIELAISAGVALDDETSVERPTAAHRTATR